MQLIKGIPVTGPDRFTALPGYGVEASVNGTHILPAARDSWMKERLTQPELTRQLKSF
jgi:hypothetical protein